MGPPLDLTEPPDYSAKRLRRMMSNALRWKCPTCGVSPIFIPWYEVRSLRDWFMPLDGCPRCGYPFEREPGYFLLSIFAINYGVQFIDWLNPIAYRGKLGSGRIYIPTALFWTGLH